MKRMFKTLISLLLVMALLLTPYSGNVSFAAEKGDYGKSVLEKEEISANENVIKDFPVGSYGGDYVPNGLIPNPDYVPPEENLNGLQSSQMGSVAGTNSVADGAPIEDGVYAIMNLGNQKYMDSYDGGTKAGTPMVQWERSEYYSGSSTEWNRSQLFKVTYIGMLSGRYYYSIRPMTNNGMGVSAPKNYDSNLVDMQEMGISDVYGDIAGYQRWVITATENYGYTIENTFLPDTPYLTAPMSTYDGEQLYLTENDDSNYFSRWDFEPYEGDEINGMGMNKFTYGVAKGSYFIYEPFCYSTVIGRNGPPTFDVLERDGSITDKATISNANGKLQALEMGEINILTGFPGAPWYWIWNAEVQFEHNGVYMFRNKGNEQYIQSISSGDGLLKQKSFLWDDVQKWQFVYDTAEGLYRIKNLDTDLYLTAPTISSPDGYVFEQSYSSEHKNRQLWKFIKTGTDDHKIQAKAFANTNYVILLNGTYIRQGTYVDDTNYNDNWRVRPTTKTLPIRILYDSSMNVNQNIYIDALNYATTPIYEQFGIKFEFQYIEKSSKLTSSGCGFPADEICTNACGPNNMCGYMTLSYESYHHKSAGYKLKILTDENYYTLRIVPYQLCYYSLNKKTKEYEHGGVAGLANIIGRESIVMHTNGSALRWYPLVQHELSHNIGARDSHEDNDSQICIMKSQKFYTEDTWCELCKANIINGTYNN